jgi:hypothetical protein
MSRDLSSQEVMSKCNIVRPRSTLSNPEDYETTCKSLFVKKR